MTLPANVRVNTPAPFPATVKGNGPVTIAKANGIWTVGFSITNLGQLGAGTDPTKVQLLVWDELSATFQQTTIAALTSTNSPATKINHTNSPYTPLASDTFLLVDTTGGAVEIDLTLAADRNGVSLAIKDYKGDAATNNITIKPQAGETVDSYTNAAPLVLQANYDGVQLRPGTAEYIIIP